MVCIFVLQRIISKYNADLKFTANVLNYFEKWIYMQLARLHFLHKEKLAYCSELVRELFLFPIMTRQRTKRIDLSIKNRYICLLEVTGRLGFRFGVGIFVRSFRRNEI